MALAVIQVCTNNFPSGGLATWSGTPFVANVTAGSTIAVTTSAFILGMNVVSVTDNLNPGTYTPFPGSFQSASSHTIEWFYMPNTAAGALTITVTVSGPLDASELFWALELAGLGRVPVTDGALVGNAPSGTFTSIGTFSQTNDADILLVAFRGGSYTSGNNSWTSPTISGSGPGQIQYLITNSIAPHFPAASKVDNNPWIGSCIAFKAVTNAVTLTADGATNVMPTTATLNGTIVSENGLGNATSWGFHYGITSMYGGVVTLTGSMDTGSFSANITGLSPGVVYHYQAWAINPVGSGTSMDATFFTTPIGISVAQTPATFIDGSSAAIWSGDPFSLNVTEHNCIAVCVSTLTNSLPVVGITDNLNAGSYTPYPGSFVGVNSRTVQWFYMPNTVAGSLTITVTLSSGQAGDLFWAFELNGLGLVPLTDGALTGTSPGTIVTSFGPFTQTNAADILLLGFRGGNFASGNASWVSPVVSGLGPGQTQYFITSSISPHNPSATMSSPSPFSGSLIAFQQASQTLTVITSPATSITPTSVVLNGNLGSVMNAVVWGFNYGLTAAYGSLVIIDGNQSGGPISATITGLSPGVTYHYQAFALTASGSGNGLDTLFITSGNINTRPAGSVMFNGPPISKGTTSSGSVANLFDGTNDTGWATSDTHTWAGIDCGVPAVLTSLRYTATPASEDVVALGAFIQGGQSDPINFFDGVTVYTFPNVRPLTGTLLNEAFMPSGGVPYRYYNARAPVGHQFPFYDLDFIGQWIPGVYSRPVQPVITPPYANVDLPIVVTMSTISTRSDMYYTVDGSVPTISSTLYTGPFVVQSDAKLQAVAYDPLLTTPYSRIASAYYVIPSKIYSKHYFYDDRGYKLCCFEGTIFQDPVSKWWYQYGANSDAVSDANNHLATLGINIYRSADLRNWTYMGVVMGPAPGAQIGYRHLYRIRSWVFYNAPTQLYVMWVDNADTLGKGIEVWTSPYPDARQNWTQVAVYNTSNLLADGVPVFDFYGDMGFLHDPVSGNPYIIYNYHTNSLTAISPLDPSTFANTLSTGGVLGMALASEAHSMFYRNGIYFLLNSGLYVDAFGLNHYWTSSSPIGPWAGPFNPFVTVSGDDPPSENAYNTQTMQPLLIPGRGPDAFIWVGSDGGNPVDPTKGYPNMTSFFDGAHETKVTLPIKFPTQTSMSITWIKPGNWFEVFPNSTSLDAPWVLDTVFPTVSGAPSPAVALSVSLGGTAFWTNTEHNPHHVYLDMAPDAKFTVGVISEIVPFGATAFNPRFTGNYYRIRTVNVSGTSVSMSFAPSPDASIIGGIAVARKIREFKNFQYEKLGTPQLSGNPSPIGIQKLPTPQ